jgi:hypothetical protein
MLIDLGVPALVIVALVDFLLWANKLNIKYCIMIFLAEIYLLLEWD